jgi:hypothetical protein
MQILKASPPRIVLDRLRSPKLTVCQVKARVIEACAVIQSRLVTIYLLALCSEPVPARVSQKQVGGLNALACYDNPFVFTQETGSECVRLDLDKDLHLGRRSCPITMMQGQQGAGSLNIFKPFEFVVVSGYPGKRRETRIDRAPRVLLVGVWV